MRRRLMQGSVLSPPKKEQVFAETFRKFCRYRYFGCKYLPNRAKAAAAALTLFLSSYSQNQKNVYNINYNAELQWSTVPAGLAFVRGQVMIGNTAPRDPAFLFDVQGLANIDEILTTSVTTYSDKRLKMNINNMSTNNNILDLASFEYNYIMRPEVTEIGFIAQDVERVAPQIVREHNGYKTIQYDRLGVLLLPIVKQQQQQLDTLICELSDLKGLFTRSSESMPPPLLSLEGRT